MGIGWRAAAVAVGTLLAALALSASASAFEFTMEPTGSIRLASSGPVTFSDETGAFRISCSLTLSGSLRSSSFATSAGTSFGEVSEGSTSGCTGGTITMLGLSEKWPMAYEAETGELPDGMREWLYTLRNAALLGRYTLFGIPFSCLYRGNLALNVAFRPVAEYEENPYNVTTASFTGNRIALVTGESCPASARVNGTMAFSATQRLQAGPRFRWNPAFQNFGSVRVRTTQTITVRVTNNTRAACTVSNLAEGMFFTVDQGRLRNGIAFADLEEREIDFSFRSENPTGARAGSVSFTCNGLQAFSMQGTAVP